MSDDRDQTAALEPGESFDAVVLPHLDVARRLARWLVRDEQDAEDVVQEASLRAFRYFRTFGGGNGRAWFLRIVRNTCYGWRSRGLPAATDSFDEEQHSTPQSHSDPETLLLQTDDASSLARAMSRLPPRLRQVLSLREVDGLSYRELSDVIGIPAGTVMSRLSRAREALRSAIDTERQKAGRPPSGGRPVPSRRTRRLSATTRREPSSAPQCAVASDWHQSPRPEARDRPR